VPPERPPIPVPEAPRGRRRLLWLGPGFLWMVSAAGSGELLFTPRVGALYGYGLLWALLAAVALKWAINREVGRFAVCAGVPLLAGVARLPRFGPWALGILVVPQLAVAVATIAGLASASATALALALPGDVRLWSAAALLAAAALAAWGRYGWVEKPATAMALALGAASVAAAAAASPSGAEMARGLVPRIPPDADYGEILPWLGFMLSGAAGMIWYSYWICAKGYGAAGRAANGSVEPPSLRAEDRSRLSRWVGQMTLDNTVAFLVLGAEFLRPQGLVPEEDRVAATLGRLLGGVWGRAGFWFMVLGAFIGFWSTVLSDQDGFGRMFADGTRLLLRRGGREPAWAREAALRRVFVIVVLTAAPMALYLAVGKPVGLLKLAGAIEAAHIPVVAGLTLFLNARVLPEELRPSWPSRLAAGFAGAFFAVFAVLYLHQIVFA
jgi:Mn2+/Fe2+ NRAMP family transporter